MPLPVPLCRQVSGLCSFLTLPVIPSLSLYPHLPQEGIPTQLSACIHLSEQVQTINVLSPIILELLLHMCIYHMLPELVELDVESSSASVCVAWLAHAACLDCTG